MAKSKTAAAPAGATPNIEAPVLVEIARIKVVDKHDRRWDDKLNAEVASIAESIKTSGLQSPIRVHWLNANPEDPSYGLTFGELRLAAAKLAGLTHIPSTIGRIENVREERAIENLQRPELGVWGRMCLIADVVEETTAQIRVETQVKPDQELSAKAADAIRIRAVAAAHLKTGIKPEQIRDLLFLYDLDKTTRDLVLAEKLPWQYARKLAAIADPEVRAGIAKDAAISPGSGKYSWGARTQPIPLKELEEKIARVTNTLDKVPWKLDVEFAGAPACNECPSNSLNRTGLFETGRVQVRNPDGYGLREKEISAAGVCLKDSCYRGKSAAFNRKAAGVARRVEITVRGLTPKEKEPAKREVVNAGVPDWANADKFKRTVGEKVKLKTEAVLNPSSGGGASVKKTQSPQQSAAEKLDDALSDWREKVQQKANKELAKKPAARELLRLLCSSKQYAAADGDKVPAKAQSAAVLLTASALQGNGAAFEEIVGQFVHQNKFDQDIEWYNVPGVVVDHLSAVFNIDIVSRPKLEDFLPKPKAAEKPAAKQHAAAKAKAAKPGKKKSKKTAAKGKAFTNADLDAAVEQAAVQHSAPSRRTEEA